MAPVHPGLKYPKVVSKSDKKQKGFSAFSSKEKCWVFANAFHKQGPATRVFHKLSAIQDYQLCLSCAFRNELNFEI